MNTHLERPELVSDVVPGFLMLNTLHLPVRGHAQEFDDEAQLVHVVLAGAQWLPAKHLANDASH